MLRKKQHGAKMPSDTEDLRATFLAFLADGPAAERAPFYADHPHPDRKILDAERWPRLAAMWQAKVSRRWGNIIARGLGVIPGAGRVEFDGFAGEAAARYEANARALCDQDNNEETTSHGTK